MNINIKNYNGINNLNYDLIDNKINFLFGISGAGKSSIASALTDNNIINHVTVGKNISDLVVLVNGAPVVYPDFKIFDLNYLEDVLITKEKSKDIYSILIGDGGRISQCKMDYTNAITDLLAVKDDLVNALKNVSTLVKELKLKIVKGGEFSQTSLNTLMQKNAESIPTYRNAVTYNSKEIKWMKDGTSMPSYSRGVCPFCGRKISQKRKDKIDGLIVFDSKTYEKINSQNNVLVNLGLSMPDWKKKREVNAFNNRLKKYYLIKPELEKFISYIEVATSMEIQDININVEKPTKLLSELYPNVSTAVTTFNSNIASVKKALGKLRGETQKVINNNIKIINEKMDLLGMPYKFIKKSIDEQNKTAGYCIVHKLDTNDDIDRVKNLSFGEKNILALLLFLLANEDSIGIIIDDPASSFDDYRRKVIFDMIYDLHKASSVLVLSHDAVFAKYAIFHKNESDKLINSKKSVSELQKKFSTETGNVDFMESYSQEKIIKIELDDFGNLEDFVLKRLNNLPHEINYQTAINLRAWFELKKEKNKVLYEYLSAIIHQVEYTDIQFELAKAGKQEKDILDAINEKIGIQYSALSSNYKDSIESFNYLDFEKIYKCRELLKSRKKKDKVLKDELSNIIHMNSAYSICLNPYKYDYFSRYVKNYIDAH